MKRSQLKVLTIIAVTLVAFGTSTQADDLIDSFTIVHKSLALVRAAELGSGFVVHSSPESSAVLTAAHILGGKRSATVYLNDNPSVGYTASILEIDRMMDLALLSIRQGRMVPMILSTRVEKGERIAVTGYPYSSLGSLKELRPSLHDGMVSSVRHDGKVFEYRTTTDRANTGSPVFDAASGYYVGIVSHSLRNPNGLYEAVGPSAVHDFLEHSGLDIATMEYTSR